MIDKNSADAGPINNQSDLYDEKKIIVNQECKSGELHLHAKNQNDISIENVHFTDMNGKTYVVTNENGIAIVPFDKQGRLMKIFKGAYIPEIIKTETCPKVNNTFPNEITQETKSEKQNIPTWIRTNAAWWAGNQINDTTFVSGIQYLIEEGILSVHQTDSSISQEPTSNEVPNWVKNNADWWAQGLLSDGDFLKGIEFLVKNRIITISE